MFFISAVHKIDLMIQPVTSSLPRYFTACTPIFSTVAFNRRSVLAFKVHSRGNVKHLKRGVFIQNILQLNPQKTLTEMKRQI